MIRRFLAAAAAIAVVFAVLLSLTSPVLADQQSGYQQTEQTTQTNQEDSYSQTQDDNSYNNNQSNQQPAQFTPDDQNPGQGQKQSYQSEQN